MFPFDPLENIWKPKVCLFVIVVFPGEECLPQHKLLIIDLKVKPGKPHKQKFVAMVYIWKLEEEWVSTIYTYPTTDLLNVIMKYGHVPLEWNGSIKMNICESKKCTWKG